MTSDLPSREPAPELISRAKIELSASFDFAKPIRLSCAPGRLDVMGGIADYTGSIVCSTPIDRAATVILQERAPADRQLQIFSFNLFDEHLPFTFRISLDALASATADSLRREFAEPGRKWAARVAGCLFILHDQGYIDLLDPRIGGFNLALLNSVPPNAGVASGAAIQIATMMNFVDHFRSLHLLVRAIEPLVLPTFCQQVENRIAGNLSGIADHIAICSAEARSMLTLRCQPNESAGFVALPAGVRVVGMNSGAKDAQRDQRNRATRCAAFMAHQIILQKIRDMGAAASRALDRDPMNGYLANLDIDDYKRLFRSSLPVSISGADFPDRFGPTIDPEMQPDRSSNYFVLQAADHHVLEAQRVRHFITLLEQAALAEPGTRAQGRPLDMAGHLMYASHLSYSNDALLGDRECDLLVNLVRQHEPAGLYGARITARGCGGTVAVLCDQSNRTDAAIQKIGQAFCEQTNNSVEIFEGGAKSGIARRA